MAPAQQCTGGWVESGVTRGLVGVTDEAGVAAEEADAGTDVVEVGAGAAAAAAEAVAVAVAVAPVGAGAA